MKFVDLVVSQSQQVNPQFVGKATGPATKTIKDPKGAMAEAIAGEQNGDVAKAGVDTLTKLAKMVNYSSGAKKVCKTCVHQILGKC